MIYSYVQLLDNSWYRGIGQTLESKVMYCNESIWIAPGTYDLLED